MSDDFEDVPDDFSDVPEDFDSPDEGSQDDRPSDDVMADDIAEDPIDGLSDGEDVLLLAEAKSDLVLAVWEPTGEPRVDAALDLLTGIDEDDVHQHAAVFDEVHQQLRATLTDLDPAAS